MIALAARVRDVSILAYFAVVTGMAWAPAVRHVEAEARRRVCASHLQELRSGLLAYRRDHGRFPAHLGQLYPRYVRDERVFVCPAALGRIREGQLGYRVQLGGKVIASAYLLTYLTTDYDGLLKRRRGSTPLVICDQHVQDVTDETWGLVFHTPEYGRRHEDAPYLVVRMDGRVDRLPYSVAFQRKLQSSDDY